MKKIFSMALSVALLLTISTVSSFAVTINSSNSSKAVAAKKKVTVVVIKADWCSACQQVDPVMKGLMQEYGERINFVVLDVTNEETTAQAMAKANSMGYGNFFAANKKMTSTVAVFKGSKQVFKTAKNANRSDYVAAFDKALK